MGCPFRPAIFSGLSFRGPRPHAATRTTQPQSALQARDLLYILTEPALCHRRHRAFHCKPRLVLRPESELRYIHSVRRGHSRLLPAASCNAHLHSCSSQASAHTRSRCRHLRPDPPTLQRRRHRPPPHCTNLSTPPFAALRPCPAPRALAARPRLSLTCKRSAQRCHALPKKSLDKPTANKVNPTHQPSDPPVRIS